jgi:hypothetical protein
MKHRHTFFVPSGVTPPPEAFQIIPGNKKDPSVLSIKHLQAAREWKITIDSDELSTQVISLQNFHIDKPESERNQKVNINNTICEGYCKSCPGAFAAWLRTRHSYFLEWHSVLSYSSITDIVTYPHFLF